MNYIWFLCLLVSAVSLEFLDDEVETQCIENCSQQNQTDKVHYGYACDHNCHVDQCTKGCTLWKQALSRTCHEACQLQSPQTPQPPAALLYCTAGCSDALSRYSAILRGAVGRPPAPALLADSLAPTHLRLEWRPPKLNALAALGRHVQWRYEDAQPQGQHQGQQQWQYARAAKWDVDERTVLVEGLQPYSKYRFRIALLLGPPLTSTTTTTASTSTPTDYGEGEFESVPHPHFSEPIAVSQESVVIVTPADGPPASPPSSVRAAAVDPTTVSIAWEPGPFPRGPLLSYVLHIEDETHEEVINKDVPPDNSFVMVRDLHPGKNYTIEIRMRNKRGSGPTAVTTVSTPTEPQTKDVEQPPLMLGTEYSILELTHILDEPTNVYRSPRNVQLRGISFHINKKLLFITDTQGYVSKIILKDDTRINILTPQNLDFMPLDLTVDWLNDHLYIIGEIKYEMQKYVIKRCDINGDALITVQSGLYVKPSSIQVDPINGYLFWTLQDYSKGGLYRMDIADIDSPTKYYDKVKRIVNETDLGAFTFEYNNFNVLLSFQKQNTIKSVTLDGKEIKDIRTSVISPKLQKVISLVMANKKFYWTDGVDVFMEEYHEGSKSYFHNTIPHLTNGAYRKVFINLPSSQPWPTPINPPTNLQAIFESNAAKTRWHAPRLVGLQGKGAWQNWTYEMLITEANSLKTIIKTGINASNFIITDLKESTEYIVKIAAYTKSGRSPWSSEFRGYTLKNASNKSILWSTSDSLLQSNVAGEEIITVLDKKRHRLKMEFTDITWHKDKIYIVTNNSQVLWYNMTNRELGKLMDIDSVLSMAVDWIGEKLYWSNPKQQLIVRGNFNGTEQEPLLTVLAKELHIDAVEAYIYWSSGIKIECARLNGMDKFEYHDVQYFSGKQIMGMTLDSEDKYVYWIVRGSEGSTLYKAPMKGYHDNVQFSVKPVSNLQKATVLGPLCYFHKRLLWLQDDRSAAVSDLSGKNIATISGKQLKKLNLVYIMDPSLHVIPEGFDSWNRISVTPEPVDNSSVRVNGSSKSFNVTWDPVKDVNYGTVFYEVQIDTPMKLRNYSTLTVTTESYIKYPYPITPFTRMTVTVRPFTYWSTAAQTRAFIFSPPSTPSAPINPRIFVAHTHRYDAYQRTELEMASVTVRWDPPQEPNGVLKGYRVKCYYVEDDAVIDVCVDASTETSKREFKLDELVRGVIYHFTIQAYTEVGSGEISQLVSANTSIESPIPILIISKNESVFIDDMDKNLTVPLAENIGPPVKLAHISRENKTLWINTKKEIVLFDMQSYTQNVVFEIEGKPLGITVDWLERTIYYVQLEDGISSVHKLDLNLLDNQMKQTKVLEVEGTIYNIKMSPLTQTLYWLEETSNKFKLMQSSSKGSNIKPFFQDSNYPKDGNCNCPHFIELGQCFTVDTSDINTPLIIFMDVLNENILSTPDGCFCSVVVNNELVREASPLQVIETDYNAVYWANEDYIYFLKRSEAQILMKQNSVTDLMIYGQHIQPHPPAHCLSPKQVAYIVSLVFSTSTNARLRMPLVKTHQDCQNFSIATVKYTVFYREEEQDEYISSSISTWNDEVEIEGLKPFTKYVVTVGVSNYFTRRAGTFVGPPIIFQTAPGAPSKPRQVYVSVLNPNLAEVKWVPPKELNGPMVYYEIHWQTDSTISGVRQKGELSVNSTTIHTAMLKKLSPNETYTIWVRAYSENNKTSTDSDQVRIVTFPEPSDIVLLNRTGYTMHLSWETDRYIKDFKVECTLLTSNTWHDIESMEKKNKTVTLILNGLTPKTHYKFRLRLTYQWNADDYVWPKDSRFTFETLGDRPSPPGIPIIQYVKPNIYKVFWEASKENGSPIEEYRLEGKEVHFYRNKRNSDLTHMSHINSSNEKSDEERSEWVTYYNGTNTSWIINGLNDKNKYIFRVYARNAYGWSNASEKSSEFDLTAARIAESKTSINIIIIAIVVPICMCIIVIVAFSIVFCSGRNRQKKLQQVGPIPRSPDVELATLRELPRSCVHNTNVLYVSAHPTPEDLSLLPHIRRDQITLNKFLGSGAFGEVFEGKAKGIESTSPETKVAVKTLKKGASDQEKNEFLQEAQLMSHFKHEHILQLLGVCLDNDPHFIIMELMEGGDLLSYLRNSRHSSRGTPPLTLIELIKMCLDVAKGCRYLEEMHFVHRDLACRNCLVSSYDKEQRIVKIGDFGLARDIYKNDYYRKEGEGLLPVRWMSPESLVDGVFTSQSDVWAFGVLLWEIMTLGQQPYPARTNLEVLHYVRRGGRLGKPTDCPEDLHNLMLRCWEFEPEKRPTFKYCLAELQKLHCNTLSNPSTAAHNGHYISTVLEAAYTDGVCNAMYFQDENHNSSGNCLKGSSEDESSREKTPFLTENNSQTEPKTPKYLELVYEPENDGYEIPNDIMHQEPTDGMKNAAKCSYSILSRSDGSTDCEIPDTASTK